MAQSPPPQSARRHYALSALIAGRAAREARKAKPRGLVAVASAIRTHQITQAVVSERAVAEMLIEQKIDAAAEALLNSTAFTTEIHRLEAMLDAATDTGFDRLVESLVQDAGRAAESVASTVRPDIWHVRFVSLPCCSRCAVLAGKVYRYSEGFKRHPNCDCTMIPTTVASPLRQNPNELFEQGQIRADYRDGNTGQLVQRAGLSEADAKAIRDGADLSQVVNVRRKKAGLQEAGRVLSRAGRPTPEGIYRMSSTREEAVALLRKFGYIT